MESTEEPKTTKDLNSLQKNKDESLKDGTSKSGEHEYISGVKLWLVLSALTLVYFLIMLDNTILATV